VANGKVTGGPIGSLLEVGNKAFLFGVHHLALSPHSREKLFEEPELEGKLYGEMELGNGKDQFITVIIGEHEGWPVIYVDANNDEDLTNDGDGNWDGERSGWGYRCTVTVQADYSIDGENVALPYRVYIYGTKDRPGPAGRLKDYTWFGHCRREGTVEFGHDSYRIALYDGNSDGLYSDLENTILAIDVDGDGFFFTIPDSYELWQPGEPIRLGSTTYQVASVSPGGRKVEFAILKEGVPLHPILLPGYPAPDFMAKDLKGVEISLKELQGNVVLLYFWEAPCSICLSKPGASEIQQIYEQYEDKGVIAIGIPMNSNKATLESFLEQEGIQYPQLWNEDGWENPVAELYRVWVPNEMIYLIDQEGVIRHKNSYQTNEEGFLHYSKIRAEELTVLIRELLR
jgi:peroxiredoxin